MKLNENKILINFNKFNSLNDEMKIKVLKQSIKDLSNAYYLTRSKKIVNLVEQICTSKNVNRPLGGCIVYREKECLILKKA